MIETTLYRNRCCAFNACPAYRETPIQLVANAFIDLVRSNDEAVHQLDPWVLPQFRQPRRPPVAKIGICSVTNESVDRDTVCSVSDQVFDFWAAINLLAS